MQRTQIYLPDDLREQVDKHRWARGESMAEYTRKALKQRLEKEKKEKIDLEALAERVTSGVKKSGWDDINVTDWQRAMRRDRQRP